MVSHVGCHSFRCVEHGLLAAARVGQSWRFQLAHNFKKLGWRDAVGNYLCLKQKLEETDYGQSLLQDLDLLPAKLQSQVVVLRHVDLEGCLQLPVYFSQRTHSLPSEHLANGVVETHAMVLTISTSKSVVEGGLVGIGMSWIEPLGHFLQ